MQSYTRYDSILHNVQELLPSIKAQSDLISKSRAIPESILCGLKNAGVLSMTMPASFGGAELDINQQMRIISLISSVSPSVGWCVKTGTGNGYFASYLEEPVAKQIFKDISTITAGAAAPTGKAEITEGGYQISGSWYFSSGCEHATWLAAGCMVYNQGKPVYVDEQSALPLTIQCLIPTEKVTILDSWHALGLEGTGSHNFTTDGIFVPQSHSFSLQHHKVYQPGVLYQIPNGYKLNLAAVAVGIAQKAIDALIDSRLARGQLFVVEGKPQQLPELRDEPHVQDAIGRAQANTDAADAYLHQVIANVWQAYELGKPLSKTQKFQLSVFSAHVSKMCLEAVELCFHARGVASVFKGCELESCLRDMHTMHQHIMNSSRCYGHSGRILLGLSEIGRLN
ncbi:hypothetical protein ACSLBF_21330 (plasmid) [Pseudoalteromonas sp. T1lg65]|uniref:hypothetical protein n=1 Tax=Pseudoalteromonas sp. T1lg65 TaxID=2077101 RepID=UPI003F7AFCA2